MKSSLGSPVAFICLIVVVALLIAGVLEIRKHTVFGGAQVVDYVEQSVAVAAAGGLDVHQAPIVGAMPLAHLRQGVQIRVVGFLVDKAWLQVELPDKRIGYVAAAMIPGITPPSGTSKTAAIGPGAVAPTAVPTSSGVQHTPPAPQPVDVSAAASPGVSSGVSSSAPTARPKEEFNPDDSVMAVKVETKVFAGPSVEAPVFYPLSAGTLVHSEAKSKDGKWLVALTQDGRAAYIPLSAMTATSPAR